MDTHRVIVYTYMHSTLSISLSGQGEFALWEEPQALGYGLTTTDSTLPVPVPSHLLEKATHGSSFQVGFLSMALSCWTFSLCFLIHWACSGSINQVLNPTKTKYTGNWKCSIIHRDCAGLYRYLHGPCYKMVGAVNLELSYKHLARLRKKNRVESSRYQLITLTPIYWISLLML